MIRAACIATGLLLAGSAQAQDWRLLSQAEGGPIVYLDVSSFRAGEGSVKTGDLMMVQLRGGDVDPFGFRMAVDCARPRYRVEALWTYDSDGARSAPRDAGANWQDTSGKNGLQTSDLICGRTQANGPSLTTEAALAAGRQSLKQ